MSWMQQLMKVYDNNESHVGIFEERGDQRITLLPVSHVSENAQIEILITDNGDFLNAKVVLPDNAQTIVPATIDSESRTSGSAPHYLHDKLCYVAGDYIAYGGNRKREQHYKDYFVQMKQWAEFPGAPKKVKAIYEYIKKGRVIEDLVNKKIFRVDMENKVIKKLSRIEERPEIYDLLSGDVLDAFVRFDVFRKSPEESVVWEDKQLYKDYYHYLMTTANLEEGICYVTGKKTLLTLKHGLGIRKSSDRAKLISANDGVGYTYRGRFSSSIEAVQIGYEVSQKAHHALRWLIQRQGININSRYFVTFGIEETDVPNPTDGSIDLLKKLFPIEKQEFTGEIVAKELNKALQGLKHSLTRNKLENIIILALDGTSEGFKGRLAIVYYQQIQAELFFDAIEHWYNTCQWLLSLRDSDRKKTITYIGTPSIYEIAEALYGINGDPQIKKELYTRLLPCIVEKKPIPKDIIQIIYNRVKNPSSFKGLRESWNSVLNIACALINKFYEREGYSLALQEKNNSRDYLFGRLLGVAEVMESRILKDSAEERATNATRYFNAFSQHPARTWMVIRKQLTPYFERYSSRTKYYARLIQGIEDRLTTENMTDSPLSPLFLLGYSSQIQSLYTKKEEKENDSIAE